MSGLPRFEVSNLTVNSSALLSAFCLANRKSTSITFGGSRHRHNHSATAGCKLFLVFFPFSFSSFSSLFTFFCFSSAAGHAGFSFFSFHIFFVRPCPLYIVQEVEHHEGPLEHGCFTTTCRSRNKRVAARPLN
jgi:hypothetical protein